MAMIANTAHKRWFIVLFSAHCRFVNIMHKRSDVLEETIDDGQRHHPNMKREQLPEVYKGSMHMPHEVIAVVHHVAGWFGVDAEAGIGGVGVSAAAVSMNDSTSNMAQSDCTTGR